jgi:hypothetical protein
MCLERPRVRRRGAACELHRRACAYAVQQPKVGDWIKRFAREELQSFSTGGLATRFYEDFRNGLVHEARIKNGGQFSLDIGSTVERPGGMLLINPTRLGAEVRSAIDGYAALLKRDPAARQRLERALARDHARDFAAA